MPWQDLRTARGGGDELELRFGACAVAVSLGAGRPWPRNPHTGSGCSLAFLRVSRLECDAARSGLPAVMRWIDPIGAQSPPEPACCCPIEFVLFRSKRSRGSQVSPWRFWRWKRTEWPRSRPETRLSKPSESLFCGAFVKGETRQTDAFMSLFLFNKPAEPKTRELGICRVEDCRVP